MRLRRFARRLFPVFLLLCCCGCAHRESVRTAPPPPPPKPAAPTVSISAQPGTIEKGQSSTLSWTALYATSVRVEPVMGSVQAQGCAAVTPDKSTTYEIMATGPGGTASASARVTVNMQPPPPPPSPARTYGTPPPPPLRLSGLPPLGTGRSFLKPLEHEAPCYGLYSYLLLGSPPTNATRTRYLNVIAAFLSLPPIASIESVATSPAPPREGPAQGLLRAQLNIAYIPVDDSLSPADEVSAEAILKHYDYPRAEVLLHSISGGEHVEGPYLVSVLVPLNIWQPVSRHYLWQDLSNRSITSELAYAWVTAFREQTSKVDYWSPDSFKRFVLNVRTAIEIAADAYTSTSYK